MDFNKPIKIYDDRNKHDFELVVSEILWQNDNYALCDVFKEQDVDTTVPILINKKGEVFTSDWSCWVADNYTNHKNDKLFLAICGYVSLHSKISKYDLQALNLDLIENLPRLKDMIRARENISRGLVEYWLKGNYEVRVYTKVAEALKKLSF